MSRIRFYRLLIFLSILGVYMEPPKIYSNKWNVPIGVGVLLIKENQVFLVKRAYKDWGFGVIAGVLNKGESLSQSAIRHVEKEVGIVLNEADLNFVCCVHYKTDDEKEAPLVFFFSAQNWIGEPFNKEPERHDEVGWFDLNFLPAPLAPGEDQVFYSYRTVGPNPNAYLTQDWNRE